MSGSVGASGVSLGFTAEGGFTRGKSQSGSVTQLNSHLTAGGTVSIRSGGDTVVAGAVVKGDDILLNVGGDLIVQSRQDAHAGSNSSANAQGSVTVGMIGTSSASVSLGGGQGSSRGQWVTEQTAFLARNKLDAYVENHTQIDGAVLNSASGDLKLDTGTLGFSDITDYDKATQMSGQVGLTTPGAAGKMPGVTLQGSYASHDTEQKTRATLGEGEIVIRDEKKQQEIEKDGKTQELASINRDMTKAQEITKDERAGVKVYASSNSIRTLAAVAQANPVNSADLANAFNKIDPSKMSDPDYRNACDFAERLEFFGGGKPVQKNSPENAVQFIFPNGMVVRFDLLPGQYKEGQGPHINIQWPGYGINEHAPVKP